MSETLGNDPALAGLAERTPDGRRWRLTAETPLVRVARNFAESRVAVFGLVLLIVTIVAAVLAPYITPQNPYDLSEIRIEAGELPPGAVERADPPRQDFEIPIDPAAPGVQSLELNGDAPFTAVTAEVTVADPERIEIRLTGEPAEAFAEIDRLRIDGLPRGAELTVGEKHSFRSF